MTDSLWRLRCCFILMSLVLSSTIAAENRTGNYAATDSLAIAELTVEEMQFYQSEFFPLSFMEKGRQSASAWRGMPPGFIDYEFDNVRLVNPLWGFWDNQLLPVEIIRHRRMDPSRLKYRLSPVPVRPGSKPVSRVAYSQDFQFGLSYLDANLVEFYRPKSYFRLGGNNLLRRGSAQDYSQIQVNTYRGQIHHTFSQRWNVDLWYWQLRHRFRIGKIPIVDITRLVHRIGQVGWMNLNFTPDSSRRFTLTPYAYKWGDRYRTRSYSEQRKTELYSTGVKFNYRKNYPSVSFSFQSNIVRHRISEALLMEKNGQWDGEVYFSFHRQWENVRLNFGNGYRSIEDLGATSFVNLQLMWQATEDFSTDLKVGIEPQTIPLAPLFWKDDSISGLQNPKLPMRRSFTGTITLGLFAGTQFKIQSYYQQFTNAWGFSSDSALFIQHTYQNAGLTTMLRSQIWRFTLENQLTYNSNYQDVFAPQINNIARLKLHIELFKRALKVDGFAIYRYIGKWRQVEYDPLVNQYMPGKKEFGGFHLLDFKILANMKSATLFFVWENTLSEDYAFVDGYWDFFQVFRFGIYWTLFD